MIPARWEHGSDPHWIEPAGSASYPWGEHRLYGSGRHANEAAVRVARCKRLWIPSYYCQEVAAAFPRDVTLATYPDRPGALATSLAHLPFVEGDAVLVVNTLGLRATPPVIPAGITVIEDHTHDLVSDWAITSRAHYCVASLRKTLPVPDGGVVWSPSGRELPADAEPHALHLAAALARLTAMVLKASYLAGGAIDKAAFRAQASSGEANIAGGGLSGIAPFTRDALAAFPVARWRTTRQVNFELVRDELTATRNLAVLDAERGAQPYTLALHFDSSARRDQVRTALVAQQIYPAILWSLEQPVATVGPEDLDLSRRILSLHCDHRYTADDMQRVAVAVRTAVAA